MMTVDLQIKNAFEKEGMTPQQIADDQQLDVVAVKAKLIQISSSYRKLCLGEGADVEDSLNFTDDELRKVNEIIMQTAMSAETPDGAIDYKTRLSAAIYVRDDKKGRKEVNRGIQGQTFNILNFNQALESARSSSRDAINRAMGKAIEA